MPWTRATHLDQWADTEVASRRLPLLVRKLVRKTVPDVNRLNIPANEQTVRPGFDGIVECTVGNQFVPAGRSVWEMGTNQDPEVKANSDISLRAKQLGTVERSETTFVFVTPRPWHKKDTWASRMATNEGWKSVVVHDSNDLEHWLDLARDVDAWISHQTRQVPSGVQSLEQYWGSLRLIAKHLLLPEVFTASRETERQSITAFLGRSPDSLFIRTASLSDGVDFLAGLASEQAEAFQLGDPAIEPQHLSLLQNAVIVFNQDDWRQLAHSDTSLLLIPSPTLQVSSTDVASAVEAGHYVIVTGPRGIVPADRGIVLRGVQQYELEKALVSSGYSDSEAGSLAKSSTGNTTILKRRMALHPETVLPPWSEPPLATDLAFLALIGGWTHVSPTPPSQQDVPEAFRHIPPSDLTILELGGYPMRELDQLIARWKEPPEPFFLRFSDTVLITSREDAWYLLGDYVTAEQLRKFRDLAIMVLVEDNPALELEPEKRWLANVYGKRHSMSGELRKSLVETLAIMATCPTVTQQSAKNRFTSTIEEVVRSVLPKKCDWKRWASLRNHFRVIAEAVPEMFLSRIEEDLESPSPAVPQLFEEQTGSFTGGRMHCELLWALEALAWSPDYLPRVTVILAKLESLTNVPGNQSNRPENSLHEIFLLWLPHTNATVSERVASLENVLHIEPTVGWQVVLALLPSSYSGFSHSTSMPRWRPWADGWSRDLVNQQRYEYAMAIADLAFACIGDSPEKWSEALAGMLSFNEAVSKRAVVNLQQVAEVYQANTDGAYQLWDALRLIIQRHQEFSEADWAFSAETIETLQQIRDQVVPTDPVLKHLWLFDSHVELPGWRQTPYEDQQAALEVARTNAIREVLNVNGSDGLWRLIDHGADARGVGVACGKHALVDPSVAQLPRSLADVSE
ncbi:MAG: hypothetical protein KDB01_02975, partial [Planctomycetaceae bacterium]|nr:hypothetical protein [Planctomycetaceae bacterium]